MRKLFWAPIVAAVVLIAGCGTPGESQDLLFVQGRGGVSVLPSGDEGPKFQASGAVPSYDWKTVVTATRADGTTRVEAMNPSSGIEVWEELVSGRYRVKVVSGDGKLAALTPRSNYSYLYGRTESRLAITGPRLSATRFITLDGNFEPEAFSTDGKSLFVIQYLPARAPVKYQVRRLDLETERVVDVYTPDQDLQTAMRGTARVQAGSPDGTRLYTLYTLNDGGHLHTFVHVLSLDGLWAHCIDLPHDFSAPNEKEVAITVSSDNERLYVTDSDAGIVAEIDTEALTVTRTTATEVGQGFEGFPGSTQAAVADDGTVFMARGPYLEALNPDDLSRSDSWTLADSVMGLQLAEGGDRLYVGLRHEIVIIDLETGERVGKLYPPGGPIKKLGPVIRSLRDRSILKCAC
ncbi:MAG: YncE family protein [Gaiellales bacterium]